MGLAQTKTIEIKGVIIFNNFLDNRIEEGSPPIKGARLNKRSLSSTKSHYLYVKGSNSKRTFSIVKKDYSKRKVVIILPEINRVAIYRIF